MSGRAASGLEVLSRQYSKAIGDAAYGNDCIEQWRNFLTSKAYIQEMGYENTKVAFARSCEKLGTDYLDLYLIHMPFADYYGAWRAMEELYKEGRIRAIGISNFLPDRLIDFCENVSVMPTVNQLEIHPFYQRREWH